MRKKNSTNYLNEQAFTEKCPITTTMAIVGGRWKMIILWQLRHEVLRYHELRNAIPGVSEKMLSQQLKDLVNKGWIHKKEYQVTPPRTEYALTDLGQSFIPVLQSIYDWGIAHQVTAMDQH
ncbi:MAG: helix-turn-helix domain-containing protein [Bacteroidota bacterium]